MDVRCLTDDFSASPQITPANLVELKALGFTLVINNRPDGEEPGQPGAAEIESATKAAGIAYREIPVAGGFSQPQIEAMADALRGANGPVFAFCRSGTRSTLLWALAQASKGGDPEEIAAAAASAGYDIAPVRAAVEQLAATS